MIETLKKKLTTLMGDRNLMSLVKGSGVALFIGLVGYISTYITLLIIGRWYGAESVGLFVMIQTITMVTSQFVLVGFSTLTMKMIGEFRGSGKPGEIYAILKKMLQIILIIWLMCFLVLFILAEPIAAIFLDDSELAWMIRLVSLAILGVSWFSLLVHYYRGMRRIFHGELVQIMYKVGIVVLLVAASIVLHEYLELPGVIFIVSCTAVGVLSFCVLWWKILKGKTETSLTHRDIISKGWPLFVVTLSSLIMGQIDTLMIGWLLTVEDVGIYSVALRVAMITAIPLGVLGGVVSPEIARLRSKGDTSKLRQVLRLFSALIVGCALPVFLVAIIAPTFVLGLFGSDFVSGKSVLLILMIGYFVHVWSGNNGMYMNMAGHEKIYRNIVLLTSVLNIVLNLTLIPIYGIFGAAIATSASLVVWNVSANIYIVRKDRIRTFLWF